MGMEEVKTGEIDAETVNRLQVVFEHVVDESDVNAMGALCYGRIPHLFDLARNTLFSAYGYVEPEDVYREHWYMPVVNFSVKLFAPAMRAQAEVRTMIDTENNNMQQDMMTAQGVLQKRDRAFDGAQDMIKGFYRAADGIVRTMN